MRTILALLVILNLCGCATLKTPEGSAQVAEALRGAAKATTQLIAAKAPQHLFKFVLAAEELEAISKLSEPSPAMIHAVLLKLPIKELHGSTATIVVGAAEVTYRIALAGRPAVEVPPLVRQFSAALAEGIRAGLAPPAL